MIFSCRWVVVEGQRGRPHSAPIEPILFFARTFFNYFIFIFPNFRGSRDLKKPAPPTAPMPNVFSNDGSFMDKFRQLSKSGLKPNSVDVTTLAKAREAEDEEKQRQKNVEEEKVQRQLERSLKERKNSWHKDDSDRWVIMDLSIGMSYLQN